MRFKIKGVEYDAMDIRRVSLKEIIAFDRESAREGYGILWAQVEDRMNVFMRLDDEAKKDSPDMFLLLGLSIWATRILAGEKVSFGDAIDVDISPGSEEFEVIVEDGDRPPDPLPARPTRKGSGRATAASKKAKARKSSISARADSVKTSKVESSSESLSSPTSGPD